MELSEPGTAALVEVPGGLVGVQRPLVGGEREADPLGGDRRVPEGALEQLWIGGIDRQRRDEVGVQVGSERQGLDLLELGSHVGPGAALIGHLHEGEDRAHRLGLERATARDADLTGLGVDERRGGAAVPEELVEERGADGRRRAPTGHLGGEPEGGVRRQVAAGVREPNTGRGEAVVRVTVDTVESGVSAPHVHARIGAARARDVTRSAGDRVIGGKLLVPKESLPEDTLGLCDRVLWREGRGR